MTFQKGFLLKFLGVLLAVKLGAAQRKCNVCTTAVAECEKLYPAYKCEEAKFRGVCDTPTADAQKPCDKAFLQEMDNWKTVAVRLTKENNQPTWSSTIAEIPSFAALDEAKAKVWLKWCLKITVEVGDKIITDRKVTSPHIFRICGGDVASGNNGDFTSIGNKISIQTMIPEPNKECKKKEFDSNSATICNCDKDLCNGSNRIMIWNLMLATGIMGLVFLKKYFY